MDARFGLGLSAFSLLSTFFFCTAGIASLSVSSVIFFFFFFFSEEDGDEEGDTADEDDFCFFFTSGWFAKMGEDEAECRPLSC